MTLYLIREREGWKTSVTFLRFLGLKLCYISRGASWGRKVKCKIIYNIQCLFFFFCYLGVYDYANTYTLKVNQLLALNSVNKTMKMEKKDFKHYIPRKVIRTINLKQEENPYSSI